MYFSIRADGKAKVVDLEVYDVIGADHPFMDTVSAKGVTRILAQNSDAKVVNLHVNSKGGDVLDGFAIYDALNQHPARVVAKIEGIAASMASVVVMAADEVQMAHGSWMMIHDPSAAAQGKAKDLRRMADVLDAMRSSIADAYVARTKSTKDAVLRQMDAETWLTAEAAKKQGFADMIVPPKAKAGARAYACISASDLQDWTNAPTGLIEAVMRTEGTDFASVGEGATVNEVADIDITIEEPDSMTPEELAAAVSSAVAAAVAPLSTQLASFDARLTAVAPVKPAAPAPVTEVAPDPAFAASVNSACERAISTGKLTNSPESRAFFIAQARDAAALASLVSHYETAQPIVTTDALKFPAPTGGGQKFSAEQLDLCKRMGWDINALYATKD